MEKYTRFRVNKLIRDNIPDILGNNPGYRSIIHYMDDNQFIQSLKDKLVEEAEEVKTAHCKADLIEELGDVLEVFYALCKSNNITMQEIEQAREQKRALKGGFDKRIYQRAFEMSSDHPAYDIFKNQPEKYPEESF